MPGAMIPAWIAKPARPLLFSRGIHARADHEDPTISEKLVAPAKPGPIFKLPSDVVLYMLSQFMSVEDIIGFRQTCRPFYITTKQPEIWKNIIRFTKTPLEQLPPNLRWSDLSGHEVEHIVARSISLDNCWRSDAPQIKNYSLRKHNFELVDIKLLPGGKYFAAAARTGARWCLTLNLADGDSNKVFLTRTTMELRPYELQVRYANLGGTDGIVIMYLHRTWKFPQDRAVRKLDSQNYAWKMAAPFDYPMRYEAHVNFTPLATLEELSGAVSPHRVDALHATKQTMPFLPLWSYQTGEELRMPTLYVMHAQYGNVPSPFATVIVYRPQADELINVDLTDGGEDHVLVDPDPYWAFHTLAYRMLPMQHQILMIRNVANLHNGEGPPYLFHLFPLPLDFKQRMPGVELPEDQVPGLTPDEELRLPAEMTAYVSEFQISDLPNPPLSTKRPRFHGQSSENSEAIFPMAVIMHMKPSQGRGYGYTVFNLSSVRKRRTDPTTGEVSVYWINGLEFVMEQSSHYPDFQAKFFIGAMRSLILTSPFGKPHKFLGIRRYLNSDPIPTKFGEDLPNGTWDQWAAMDHLTNPVLRSGQRKAMPRVAEKWDPVELPLVVNNTLRRVGVAAMAYDDEIGRVCIVPGDDATKIYTLDFAVTAPKEDRFSHAWAAEAESRRAFGLPVQDVGMLA